jgi:hypothetical protein
MTGLSQTGRKTLDDIQSHQQSVVDNSTGGDGGEDSWEDDEDDENVPMDGDVTLSAEGREIDILLERSGA